MKYFLIYLILINLFCVILVYTDKKRAIKHKRRISEKKLFISAILGGAFAMYFAMKLFKHKTLHKRFMLGLPCIFILQTLPVIFLKGFS